MATAASKGTRYDVVVVGGGHNGLVAAGYMQRAGLRTLVLEARDVVGGACVTEEVFPGFKVSTTSYVCSLLRPKVIRELELERYGLSFLERDPSSFTPFPDGRSLTFWSDPKRTVAEIAKFSKRDADVYPRYEDLLGRLAAFVEPLLLMTPPDPRSNGLGDLWSMARLGLKARALEADLYDEVRILAQSATDFLDCFFESDELKATLATDGIIGAYASPSQPGTAYVLLHHVMGETFGRKGVWAYVRGGMGGITQAMARSFEARGGVVRTSARVAKILTRSGKAYGVVLDDGEEILATRVVSNVDPRRTFLDLVGPSALGDEFAQRVRQIRFKSATFKINLALGGVPNFTALPNVDGQPGPQHRGTMHISPSMEYIERAYDDARRGGASERPVLECTMASVVDPTLAPPGKHLMSIFAQYAPYELKGGKTWDEATKNAFADRCIATLEEYAPGFRRLVEARHLLSPLDLEQTYGLTGGNIFQGEMTLDQMFFMRPLPECAQYRTPLRNLYLCGAGTHPGGGVMGASGHNAAREVLKDAR